MVEIKGLQSADELFLTLGCLDRRFLFPLLPLPSPISVVNKTIEEDRWDFPEVPMEED